MKLSTKSQSQKEEEAIEDGVRFQPKDLPPRDDLRKRKLPVADPDLKKDPDMSLNYKHALYHGPQGHLKLFDHVAPNNSTSGFNRWDYKDVRDLTFQDYDKIILAAQKFIDPQLMSYNRDIAYRQALDYAIWSYGHGVYDHKIAAPTYDILLNMISGTNTNLSKDTLLDCDINRGMKYASNLTQCNCENLACDHGPKPCKNKAGEAKVMYIGKVCDECAGKMPKKYVLPPHGTAKSSNTVNNLLNSQDIVGLDPLLRSVIAQLLKAKTASAEKMARELHKIREVLADEVAVNADEPYMSAFEGQDVVKSRSQDEPYMDHFDNTGPLRQDSDEKYMNHFTDKEQ